MWYSLRPTADSEYYNSGIDNLLYQRKSKVNNCFMNELLSFYFLELVWDTVRTAACSISNISCAFAVANVHKSKLSKKVY